jgi:hypothetical protein
MAVALTCTHAHTGTHTGTHTQEHTQEHSQENTHTQEHTQENKRTHTCMCCEQVAVEPTGTKTLPYDPASVASTPASGLGASTALTAVEGDALERVSVCVSVCVCKRGC